MLRSFLYAMSLSVAGAVGAVPAAAQSLIGEYFTLIAPHDMFNSRGQRLTDWCAIIQQERANYHRFGIRQEMDQGDPIFGSREARAAIAGNCVVGQGSEYIPAVLERGETRFLWIQIYGNGSFPAYILVREGAG
ncbi:MAG: hypothetical protein AAF865_09890 [Pseudomonadota bacterium]